MKITQYHATIARGWVHSDPQSYDPDYIWDGTFSTPDQALTALTDAMADVVQRVPWKYGYIINIMCLGPRGGIKKINLELTHRYSDMQSALSALATRLAG